MTRLRHACLLLVAWLVPLGCLAADGSEAPDLGADTIPVGLVPTVGPEVAVDSATGGFTGGVARDAAIAWSASPSSLARDDVLVVWVEDAGGGRQGDIHAARFTPDGVAVDKRSIVVSDTRFDASDPAVVGNVNGDWLVAWAENDDIAAATVDRKGVVVQLGTVVGTPAVEGHPALASGLPDGGAYLVWQSDADVRGSQFSGGAFGPPFELAVSAETESNPSVACIWGGGCLAAWQEGPPRSENIRGQYLTSTGAPSGASFLVAEDPAGETLPAVGAPLGVSTQEEFLVAWRGRGQIFARMVTGAGSVTGALPIATNPGQGSTNPSATCPGQICLVSWQDRRLADVRGALPTYGIHAQRVSLGTFGLVGSEIVISDSVRDQVRPAATLRVVDSVITGGFVTAWEDHRTGVPTVMMSPIDQDGVVLANEGIPVNPSTVNGERAPAYARGPSSQLAVWSDSRALGADVMARRFSATGAKVDTSAVPVTDAPQAQTTPSVDFDGASYVVVWSDAREPARHVYAARLGEDGTLRDPVGLRLTDAAVDDRFPVVASGGGVSLVVWQRQEDGPSNDVLGAILLPDGTVSSSEIEICRTGGNQDRPAVAWDPIRGLFVVVWADGRGGPQDIYAARVAIDGTVLDACGVPLSQERNSQRRPGVASSGPYLLAVWEDHRVGGGIVGTRVSTDGALTALDSSGIQLGNGPGTESDPTVVGLSRGRWAVAWVDDSDRALSGTDIRGNTVLADGSVEGEYLLSAAPAYESEPAFQSGANGRARAYLVYQKEESSSSILRIVRRALTY